MSAISAIQVKRRQVGLAEDGDWRDFLYQQTGKRRLTEMTPREHATVLQKLVSELGKKATSTPAQRRLEGPFAPKIQALWISAFNLGLVKSKSDAALAAFVRRQTGIDNPAWMRDDRDARAVIEALKSMIGRRGVRWTFHGHEPEHTKLPGFQITLAQFRMIHGSKSFYHWVAEMTGKPVTAMGYNDWIPLMNHLGPRVRELVARDKGETP